MKPFLTLILIISLYSNVYAQSARRYTISGYMREDVSSESLIGASVYNRANMAGTSTNQFGFYSLTLPAGDVELAYSYVGYKTQTISFALRRDTVINVGLTGSTLLQEVVVTADKTSQIERTQMSVVRVPVAQIKAMPAFMGEVDLIKVIQLKPGVQSGGEGNSGLYVRGGGPDQNLFLLDGIPMYNISHLFGLFSAINADAINNMEIIKGGFPARYGGRMSSVLDISLREGNMQKFNVEGSVGIVSAKLMVEGPIIKDKTSFIISGRRSFNDALAASLISLDNEDEGINEKGTTNYYFYDVTAKINHRFSANDRIYLSAYLGDDKYNSQNRFTQDKYGVLYDNRTDEGLKWGNGAAALRWNHVFNPKLFSNTTLSYSRYRFNNWSEKDNKITIFHVNPPVTHRDYYKFLHDSGVEDWGGKIAFDYLPSPNHYIRFGVNAIHHTYNVGADAVNRISVSEEEENGESDTEENEESIIGVLSKIYAWEYSAYFEDDIKLTERLKANVGVHWSAFGVEEKTYNSLQPRVSARYLITPLLSAKASYSRMAQYVHLLTSAGIGMPSDLWVPSTARMRPQTSDQLAAGLAREFKDAYEISLEGYYKTMNNVLEYREGSGFFDASSTWEQKVVQGKGRSYGMELFIEKKRGSFTGWIGYALSWTDRQFDELNDGRWFPYKYDRRHDISIAVTKRFGKNIEMSGTWVFGTGNCVTVPVGIYPGNDLIGNMQDKWNNIDEWWWPIYGYTGNNNKWNLQPYFDYGERNSYRMEAYHRLDLNISFTFLNREKWGEHKLIFGVYNVYNRKNPFYIDAEGGYIQDYNSWYSGNPATWLMTGTIYYKFSQYSLFPIIPSFSYHFKF